MKSRGSTINHLQVLVENAFQIQDRTRSPYLAEFEEVFRFLIVFYNQILTPPLAHWHIEFLMMNIPQTACEDALVHIIEFVPFACISALFLLLAFVLTAVSLFLLSYRIKNVTNHKQAKEVYYPINNVGSFKMVCLEDTAY